MGTWKITQQILRESQRSMPPPCNSVLPLPLTAGWRWTGSAMRTASALSRPVSLGPPRQQEAAPIPWSNHGMLGICWGCHLWVNHMGHDYLLSLENNQVLTTAHRIIQYNIVNRIMYKYHSVNIQKLCKSTVISRSETISARVPTPGCGEFTKIMNWWMMSDKWEIRVISLPTPVPDFEIMNDEWERSDGVEQDGWWIPHCRNCWNQCVSCLSLPLAWLNSTCWRFECWFLGRYLQDNNLKNEQDERCREQFPSLALLDLIGGCSRAWQAFNLKQNCSEPTLKRYTATENQDVTRHQGSVL